ncbi:hypothetical protein [Lusitaniella coriacea]
MTDVSSLGSLANLSRLWLNNNPIVDKTCPVPRASACLF